MPESSDYQNCRELLQQMVAIETVNRASSGRPFPEKLLALFLEEYAQRAGLKTRRLRLDDEAFNLIAWAEGASPNWVVFDSHMDTVSIEGMSIDPLSGEIRGGRIWGRGACDTKSSGAAMLTALAIGAREGSLANNTAVVFTTDEEVGKQGANGLAETGFAELGWTPKLVVVGEPTQLQPVIAHNGVVRWTVETTGTPAHSSRPERGRSAITDMVRVISAIEGNYIPKLSARHPLTGKAQCSINIIRGGSQINVIPESCHVEIDRRVVPGEDAHAVLPTVEEVLEILRAECPGLRVRQRDAFIDPPMEPLEEDKVISWTAPVLEKHGISAVPRGEPYGTNASNYTTRGIPSVVLGPGNIAQAHTSDEWLELRQLDLAIDVYGGFMRTRLP